jgi:hypothetical protein
MSDAMLVTSHPLAARAGQELLTKGGSATDAAVAAAAVLTAVDPRSTGLGGDLFALHWTVGDPAPIGLASAGIAASGLTVDALRAAGFTAMPRYGPWTVTVPGAPAGREALLKRFGRLERTRCWARPSTLRDPGSLSRRQSRPSGRLPWTGSPGTKPPRPCSRRWPRTDGGRAVRQPQSRRNLTEVRRRGQRAVLPR